MVRPHDGASSSRLSRGTLLAAAGAAAASATALWVAQRARRAEREQSPSGRFVVAGGVRLHCVDEGEGATVVLLHGNNASLRDFEASGLIRRLAARYRVIAFDRPGYGHSERPRDRLWTPAAQADALREALRRLGVTRPIVVGHSMGALVALSLAFEPMADARGLLLLGGYYYPTARLDALAMAPVAVPLLGDVLRYTVTALSARALLNRAVQAMFAPQPVPEGYVETLSREMLLRPSQLRADAEDGTFLVPAAASARARYGALRLPVSIMAGAEDRVVDPQAHSVRLAKELPQADLVLVPGSGHMVHHADPAAVVAAVDSIAAQR